MFNICRCVFDVDGVGLTEDEITIQLNQNLAINVFKGGKWGSYRHIPQGMLYHCFWDHLIVRGQLEI